MGRKRDVPGRGGEKSMEKRVASRLKYRKARVFRRRAANQASFAGAPPPRIHERTQAMIPRVSRSVGEKKHLGSDGSRDGVESQECSLYFDNVRDLLSNETNGKSHDRHHWIEFLRTMHAAADKLYRLSLK